jgi:Protein of unknown function (DUF2587)
MVNNAQSADQGQPVDMLSGPAARVVIVLDSSGAASGTYRIEDPARLLRIWTMLSAAENEMQGLAVPPEVLPGFQRQLDAVAVELDRSLSPALCREIHRLASRNGSPMATPGELRIQYASLLGWLGALMLTMLNTLQRAGVVLTWRGGDGTPPVVLPTPASARPGAHPAESQAAAASSRAMQAAQASIWAQLR